MMERLGIWGALLVGVWLPVCAGAQGGVAKADSGPAIRRWEAGGQLAAFRIADCFGEGHCGAAESAVGPGLTWNVKPWLALDAEANATVRRTAAQSLGPEPGAGRVAEEMAGARIYARGRKYSYFGLARYGAVEWDQMLAYRFYDPPNHEPGYLYTFGYRPRLAAAYGGGLELAPSSHLRLRVELEDLQIHWRNPILTEDSGWQNTLHGMAGAYWSFGPELKAGREGFSARDAHPHRFLDRENEVLLLASLLGQSADAITTQRFEHHGILEGNPFARPLVKYGWSGQIAAGVLVNGAEIVGMWSLHRIHQHWAERAVPTVLAGVSGWAAYGNLKQQ